MTAIVKIDTITSVVSMTSREIAELTGKRPADVMRDIRNMLDCLEIEQNAFLRFDNSGANGRRVEFFTLPKDLTLSLMMGYKPKLRMAVLQRLKELEAENQILLAGHQEILNLEGNEEAKAVSKETLAAREDLRLGFKPFTVSVQKAYIEEKEAKGEAPTSLQWVVPNFCKLVTKVATGMNLKAFKEAHDGLNPREYYTKTDDLAMLLKLRNIESCIEALSYMKLNYQQVKEILEEKYEIKL